MDNDFRRTLLHPNCNTFCFVLLWGESVMRSNFYFDDGNSTFFSCIHNLIAIIMKIIIGFNIWFLVWIINVSNVLNLMNIPDSLFETTKNKMFFGGFFAYHFNTSSENIINLSKTEKLKIVGYLRRKGMFDIEKFFDWLLSVLDNLAMNCSTLYESSWSLILNATKLKPKIQLKTPL